MRSAKRTGTLITAISLAIIVLLATSALASGPWSDPRLSASPMTFQAVADARISQETPSQNFGGSTQLVVAHGEFITASLVRFNLSGLPSGAIVDNAILRVYVVAVSGDLPKSVVVAGVKSAWIEGSVT